MPFQLILDINIGADTESDFFDEIVSQNEGDAIQALANGKALDFSKVTAQQKSDYVRAKMGEQFANIYFNAKLEREVQNFRASKIAERGVTRG